MISPEEGFLLLKGFKDKTTPIRVNMVTRSARCAFEGLISEINEQEVILMIPAVLRVSCAMLFRLKGARFEYGDTREAPEDVRESLAEKFSSALSILLADKTLIVISELNR